MIPGLVLFARTPRPARHVEGDFDAFLRTAYQDRAVCEARAGLGDWLACGILARNDDAFVHRHDDPRLTVLLSGYLSDVVGAELPGPPQAPAGAVARMYQDAGVAAFGRLRGSFCGVILDRQEDTAVVFNDRVGSRPIFLAGDLNLGLVLAPECKPLSRLREAWLELDPVAVGEYLVRGCCYGSATLFKAVHKVDQATVVRLRPEEIESQRYWRPRFGGDRDIGQDALTDELDGLLSQSTRRLLSVLPDPALLLSGGVDSRLMLAYLLRHDRRLPSFSYHVNPSTGEDHVIAARLAQLAGIAHQPFAIEIDDFAANAAAETLACDGRVQICDAPSSRWQHIGERYRSMFIGDECFGWKGEPKSLDEALDIVGWWNIDVSPRVCDCLSADALQSMRQGIGDTLRHMVDGAHSSHPTGVKDELYYAQRVANLLNGFSARRLAVCEQARPLLDEDVIDFFARVPHALRLDKKLVRDLLARRFPELAAVPYSRKTSVPWDESIFLKLVGERPQLKEFIVANLSSSLGDRLGALFDRPRLEALARSYLDGAKLPPFRDDWWSRIPGGWRFARERVDKVGTLRSLLRIMQLNIYLSSA